ncbi:phosphatase PAP2 family protein [Nocardia sp. NPDC051030]|uniref:phosphatase PAP2 family protein n=1 Tax=Nocardia sp. NPDC051030 TaxID=3155162 RepID=UPI003442A6D5
MVALDLDGASTATGLPSAGVIQRTWMAVRGRGWEALGQLALITVLYMIYRIGRILAAGEETRALDNAHELVSWENTFQMVDETRVQAVFVDHEFLAKSANIYYATAHFTVAVVALIWLWAYRPSYYRLTRNLMVAITAAALLLHVLMPIAPPRMLPEDGFVDLAARYGPSVYGPPETDHLSNQFAAMPSLHVGWAMLLAVALIAATRTPWRWLLLAHPAITLIVVIGTGNHYWLDTMAATTLLAVAALLHPATTTKRPFPAEPPLPVTPWPSDLLPPAFPNPFYFLTIHPHHRRPQRRGSSGGVESGSRAP